MCPGFFPSILSLKCVTNIWYSEFMSSELKSLSDKASRNNDKSADFCKMCFSGDVGWQCDTISNIQRYSALLRYNYCFFDIFKGQFITVVIVCSLLLGFKSHLISIFPQKIVMDSCYYLNQFWMMDSSNDLMEQGAIFKINNPLRL